MSAATDSPTPLQWSIDHHPSDHVIQALRRELIAYNIATVAIDASRNLAVLLHDAHGHLRGGIVGTIWGQCVEITYLWVHPSLRGHGYGSRRLRPWKRQRGRSRATGLSSTRTVQAPICSHRLG